ncbi:class I SAM-dependent methyltransferase [Candidatus Micrarchaeota archaeon]|nr:class I SAM-dependent methyltransferase [Candidatus Micrarchaeota archaeon]
MRKLNLGCGKDIRDGFVNVDYVKLPGVDIACDIEKGLPFKDGEFDYIVCQDVLEHMSDAGRLMREMHRVLKDGGVLEIRVPHFSSINNYIDVTHKRMFSVFSFDFFLEPQPGYFSNGYYFDFKFSKDVERKIEFGRLYSLLYPVVNINRTTQLAYEQSFLSRLFPAVNIRAVLKR